jgi:hypothetical protein
MSLRRHLRRPAVLSRLPRRGYIIREKYLRRYRTLARQLSDTPLDPDTTFDGLLHMGEDGNEIWVEASLSEAEKRFTIVHELVHARRQRAGEDFDDDALEEPIVELETIARVGKRILSRMSSGMTLMVLHDYLTRCGRDDPETPRGLRAVYARIRMLLGMRESRPAGAMGALAAHRRPTGVRRSRGR